MKILNYTASYCGKCRTDHKAWYEKTDNIVTYKVDCPEGLYGYKMTNDAALFIKNRMKSFCEYEKDFQYSGFRMVNVIELTDSCNYSCNICYKNAKPSNDYFMDKNDAVTLVKAIRKEGGRIVILTGGESMLHPDILYICREVNKKKMFFTMPTNGLKIAGDPDLAVKLKKNGLKAVSLQFDTLDPETQFIHRNNRLIDEKIFTLKQLKKNRIMTVACPTITSKNIDEIPELLKYFISNMPGVYLIPFQPFFDDGFSRYHEDHRIFKEDIVHKIIDSGVIRGLNEDHFRPLPKFLPMKTDVHPDCGSVCFIVNENGMVYPLDKIMDMDKAYKKLASYKKSCNTAWAFLLLIKTMIEAVYKGKKFFFIRCFINMIRGRGKNSLLLIAVESFFESKYQDNQRSARCASAVRILQKSFDKKGRVIYEAGVDQDGCFAKRK